MSYLQSPMRVLLDEGAPVAVADPFLQGGHEVIGHGEVLAAGARDQLVAFTAISNGAILIAVDRDMKQLTKRFGSSEHEGKYKNLDLILVCCKETIAARRFAHAMTFIEHECWISRLKKARKLWVEIGNHRLVSHR